MSCIRKIVESILNFRLTHWIEQRLILPHNMFGFRQNKWAIDCVETLVADIYLAFIKKEYLSALFIDIISAFPSVYIPTP